MGSEINFKHYEVFKKYADAIMRPEDGADDKPWVFALYDACEEIGYDKESDTRIALLLLASAIRHKMPPVESDQKLRHDLAEAQEQLRRIGRKAFWASRI